jgi:hypothetical protein
MSDTFTILIPEDPYFLPDPMDQERARRVLAEISPDADEIRVEASKEIQFHCCVEYFTRIICEKCHAEISRDWWVNRMKEDYENEKGFKLAKYDTPCCHSEITLNDLTSESPQGFARFSMLINPDIGSLEDQYLSELEEVLGTKLRIIHVRI